MHACVVHGIIDVDGLPAWMVWTRRSVPRSTLSLSHTPTPPPPTAPAYTVTRVKPFSSKA